MSEQTERFSKQEMWGLYWVAWWMGQQEDKRQLGGTLTVALQTIREMIGPIPNGYDPLDDVPAAAVPSAEVLAAMGTIVDYMELAHNADVLADEVAIVSAYLAAQETPDAR